MKRRGQVAIEFLTTYGWAFLVILVMIGALAYFGVLKPSRLLPDRCTVGPEFECLDFQISETDSTIKLRLKNNVGEPIALSGMTASVDTATPLTCDPPSIAGTWPAAEIKTYTFTNCNLGQAGYNAGDKSKIAVAIDYHSVRSGIDFTHKVHGEVFGNVI